MLGLDQAEASFIPHPRLSEVLSNQLPQACGVVGRRHVEWCGVDDECGVGGLPTGVRRQCPCNGDARENSMPTVKIHNHPEHCGTHGYIASS